MKGLKCNVYVEGQGIKTSLVAEDGKIISLTGDRYI